ncbi:Flp pilus assembly complex ATPase component TadA [bacterium]|nr:Flp pilus assembly complex ATPase component TadA [candidate division CSSED10-310 bacterium]
MSDESSGSGANKHWSGDSSIEFKLGELLREAGLVTPEHMEQMLKQHDQSGIALKDILKKEVSLTSLKALMLYEVPIPFLKNRDKSQIKSVLLESGIITDQELTRALDDEVDSEDQLGELLLSKGYIHADQLDKARSEQKKTGLPLWRVLLNLRLVNHSIIADLMKSRIGRGVSKAKEDLIIEILLNGKLISPEIIEKAQSQALNDGSSIVSVLIKNKLISLDQASSTLEKILDIPFINLSKKPPDPEMAFVIPEHVIRMYKILPIASSKQGLLLGMVDPLDDIALQKVRLVTGQSVIPCLISSMDWEKTVTKLYSTRTPKGSVSEMERKLREGTRTGSLSNEDISAVQLASSIIDGAINASATDIHLEPQIPEMRVRYRIDGVLYDVMTVPKHLELPVVSRIKLLSGMDITEKRRPQDGHFSMELLDRVFNFRSASIPTCLGEKLTIRFLDEARVMTGLQQLGWEKEELDTIENLIKKPNGMILVTGPIGSGKTTTLYAALNQTNILNSNIITIEDPVEYRLAGINQIQVNPDIGLDFRSGLRSILRHDADIIMVGEVRDAETAIVATWAALTGQLVFCTLHTKDAVGAITMMANLGVEHYLIASSLIGVVAQRLVRKLCSHCKTFSPPSEALRKQLGWEDDPKVKIGVAVGCDKCFQTGYHGRTAIFEVLVIDHEISNLIAGNASDDTIRSIALHKGMRPLSLNGIKKIRDGVTTPEEVLREINL